MILIFVENYSNNICYTITYSFSVWNGNRDDPIKEKKIFVNRIIEEKRILKGLSKSVKSFYNGHDI